MIFLINMMALALPSFIFFLYKYARNELERFFLYFLFLAVVFAIYSGRSIESGIDYYFYWEYYSTSLALDQADSGIDRFEPGVRFLYFLGYSVLGLPPAFFFGCIGALMWGVALPVLRQFGFLYFLLFFAFLLPNSFNLIRQSLAVIALAVGVGYFVRGMRLSYYFTVLASMMFHYSAMYMLILPFLCRLYVGRIVILLIYFVSLIVPMFVPVLEVIDFSLLEGVVPSQYLWYVNNAEYSFSESEGRVSSGIGLIMAVLLAVFFIVNQKAFESSKAVFVFYVVYTFSQVVMNLFPSAEAVGRALLYAVVLKCVLLPYLFYRSYDRRVQILCLIFVLFEVLVFIKLGPIKGLIY